MRTRDLRLVLVLTAVTLAAIALAAALARAAVPGSARVTYLAGGSVYVDAGTAEGVLEGDTLTVTRDGALVARLRAAFLSTHRAACDTLPGSVLPRVGDVARFVPHALPGPPAATAAPLPPEAAVLPDAPPAAAAPEPATTLVPNPPAASHMRGRLGVRVLAIQSREAGDVTQPALDARFEAVGVGGSPFDLAADVRGRRTTRPAAGGGTATEAATRVYRLAASVHDAAAQRRLTLGRQSSPLLSSVSLFDGALGQWGSQRWSVGAFGGTQPDPDALAFSSDVWQGGAFVEARSAPRVPRRWSLALGGVTSSVAGAVNRDFLFAQGHLRDGILSATFAQEADVLRGWRREGAGSALSLTSTFVLLRAQVRPWAALHGGYDGRRSVRLYRDRETPETAFDDRFREGAWAGLSLDAGRHLRFGGDGRWFGSAGDRVTSWSATAEALRLGPMNARLRARGSGSDGDLVRTRLAALGLGLDPLDGAHLEVGGGVRTTSDALGGSDDRATWTHADLDLALVRRLLVSITWERTAGDFEHVDQEYAGLSWRF